MEIISDRITIKHIFLHHGNWSFFYFVKKDKIRPAIISNVAKLLACRTPLLGFHQYSCTCGNTKKVFHTCKSRFCNSCGKKLAEKWIREQFNKLPNTTWQHITFTMPREFWDLFWLNRHLLSKLSPLAASAIQKIAHAKKLTPGIFTALHTFGRDLKRNVHIHLSTTNYGLTLDHQKVKKIYFEHQTIKNQWKYLIIDMLRCAYKKGKLTLTNKLNHIKSYTTFNSWLNVFYNKKWVVHLSKPTDDHKKNIEYLGRYIKRPPIAESRIINYDGKRVTFTFFDHHSQEHTTKTLGTMAFIERIINHIPDKGFQLIRYYGFLANRVRTKLLKIFEKISSLPKVVCSNIEVTWRNLIKRSFGKDPLQCNICQDTMRLSNVKFPPSSFDIFSKADELFKQIIWDD